MTKNDAYKWAAKRIRAQVQRHVDIVPTMGNSCAILKEYFSNYFWVGFYWTKESHLQLGPFQGPPACVKLSYDKGVCAASANEGKTIVVPNVHEFPGHVACDSRSNSEIVVPVYNSKKEIVAVLDIDSESLNDFDQEDQEGLENIVQLFEQLV